MDKELIALLMTLDKSEKKNLEKYLLSPIFNTNEKIVTLYKIIIKAAPNYESSFLNKNEIAKKISVKPSYIRTLFPKLRQLTLDYIAFNAYQKSKEQNIYFLLSELLIRGVPKQFIKIWEKHHKDITYYNINDYQLNNLLTELMYSFSKKNAKKFKDFSSPQQAYDQMLESFFIASSIKLLHYFGIHMNEKEVINALHKKNLINKITSYVHFIEKSNLHHITPINIYYSLVQLLLQDQKGELAQSNKYFVHLKKLLEQPNLPLGQQSLKIIYKYMTNFCLKRLRNGYYEYLQESFDCCTAMINKKLLLVQNKKLPKYLFRHIISVAVQLGKLEWTILFLEEYKQYLSEEIREDVVKYNYAIVYFYQHNYQKAVSFLRSIEDENNIIKHNISTDINTRLLYIRLYYELNEQYLLESHIEKTRVFLGRIKIENKISENALKDHNNFNNIIKRIFQQKEQINLLGSSAILGQPKQDFIQNHLKDLTRIKRDIANKETLSNSYRKWLIEKISELEARLHNHANKI